MGWVTSYTLNCRGSIVLLQSVDDGVSRSSTNSNRVYKPLGNTTLPISKIVYSMRHIERYRTHRSTPPPPPPSMATPPLGRGEGGGLWGEERGMDPQINL